MCFIFAFHLGASDFHQWQIFLRCGVCSYRGPWRAVAAVVAVAGARFAKAGVRDGFTAFVAVGAAVAELALRKWTRLEPDLTVLAAAAVLGILWYGRPRLDRIPLWALLPLGIVPAH